MGKLYPVTVGEHIYLPLTVPVLGPYSSAHHIPHQQVPSKARSSLCFQDI